MEDVPFVESSLTRWSSQDSEKDGKLTIQAIQAQAVIT